MASTFSTTSTSTVSTSESDSGATTIYETFTSTYSAPSTSSTRTITPDSTQTSLLGPLTTTFTAPSRCSQAYWFSTSSQFYYPTIGQVCATVGGKISYSQDSGCLPPVKSTILGSLVGSSDILYTTYDYQGYYSPAIACPAGYSTACAAQAGADGIQSALSNYQSFGFAFSATADETAVGCCPTGYQCTNRLYSQSSSQWCQQVIASTTQPLITCINGTNGAAASSTTHFTLPTNVTFSYSDTLLSTEATVTTTVTLFTMFATMIQMNFQATDLASTTSLSSTSVLSTSSLPTNSNSTGGSGSSNHKTTTIAVSVVIPCVAILIAASLGWFYYRRRAKNQLLPSGQAAQSARPGPESSNSYYGAGTTSEPSEMLGSPARVEMEGSPVTYEMAGTDANAAPVRHEMYAGK